jgi:hypothetical protein
MYHQEKPRRLVQPLLWGQQQCQKKHQHQQKACRELGGAGSRYTYQSLSIATNNFEKRASEGVGQSFKECWRRGRVLL